MTRPRRFCSIGHSDVAFCIVVVDDELDVDLRRAAASTWISIKNRCFAEDEGSTCGTCEIEIDLPYLQRGLTIPLSPCCQTATITGWWFQSL